MAEPTRTLRDLLSELVPELVDGLRLSWHERAACAGSSVDFFSDRPDDSRRSAGTGSRWGL